MDYISLDSPKVLVPKLEQVLAEQNIKVKKSNFEQIVCTKNNIRFYVNVEELSFVEGAYTCKMTYPQKINSKHHAWIRDMETAV